MFDGTDVPDGWLLHRARIAKSLPQPWVAGLKEEVTPWIVAEMEAEPIPSKNRVSTIVCVLGVVRRITDLHGSCVAAVPPAHVKEFVQMSGITSNGRATATSLRRFLRPSIQKDAAIAHVSVPRRHQPNAPIRVGLTTVTEFCRMYDACTTLADKARIAVLLFSLQRFHNLELVSDHDFFLDEKRGIAWFVLPRGHRLHGLRIPILHGSEAVWVWCERARQSKSVGSNDDTRLFAHPDGKRWTSSDALSFLRFTAKIAGVGEELTVQQIRTIYGVYLRRTTFGPVFFEVLFRWNAALRRGIESARDNMGPETPQLKSAMSRYLNLRRQGHPEDLRCPACGTTILDSTALRCTICLLYLEQQWTSRNQQGQAILALNIREFILSLGADQRKWQRLTADSRMPWGGFE